MFSSHGGHTLTPSPSQGLCFSKHWADSDLHCNCCATPTQTHGNLIKAQRGRQGNAKLIFRNKVFECLTLLGVEVIEYGKNGLQNGLKCILRDIDFKQKSGEVHRTPSNERGRKTPSHTLPAPSWLVPLHSSIRLSVPPKKQPLRVQPCCGKISLYIYLNPIELSRICV